MECINRKILQINTQVGQSAIWNGIIILCKFLKSRTENNMKHYPSVGNSQCHDEIPCQDKPSITVTGQQLADDVELILLQKIHEWQSRQLTHTHTHNYITALCQGLPGWAGTRRNIHPLTPMKKKKKDLHRRHGLLWASNGCQTQLSQHTAKVGRIAGSD